MGMGNTTLKAPHKTNATKPMDLLKAATELSNIAHTSMLVVDAWRHGSQDALTDALTELETELIRIESEE